MSNLDHSSIFEEDVVESKLVTETREVPKKLLTYEDFDFHDLQLYGGLDCIATSEILAKILPTLVEIEDFHIQNIDGTRETIKAPAIIESIEGIEMKAHEFIIDLEINGIGYSKSRNESMGKKMLAEVEVLNDKIFTKLGRKVNLDSGVEVAELLYSTLGFEVPFTTKGGEPATDGVALMTLAGLDPLGGKYVAQDPSLQYLADMAKRRDIHSVYNTFIKTYYIDWVKADGRIHPSYNLHGTSSFRITGSDPNLTQLPRAKHGYNVRACFVVPNGRVFISFDFSSAEIKILANLACEPAMLKAIEDGLDFHSFSASAMYNIAYEEFMLVLADKSNPLFKRYKELRQISKVLGFSILYGSSTAGIAKQLFLTTDEAQALVDMYFKTFPGVRKYIEGAHYMALNNQFVLTLFGQRKREYGTYQCFKRTAAYNAAMRNAQNVIIQSTTSTLGLIVFASLNEELKFKFGEDRVKCICTVYDSIEIECDQEIAAEVFEICNYYMEEWPLEQFKWLQLPIGCEGDVGISWGETEVVHRGVTQTDIDSVVAKLKLTAEPI